MKPNRNKWKGRKWIDTSFAKKYREASALYRVMAAVQVGQIARQIGLIRSAPAVSSFDKIAKSAAIASAAIDAFSGAASTMREFNKNYGHMRSRRIE